MKRLSFTCSKMMFLVAAIAVVWVIPLQVMAENKLFGHFDELGGDLNCFKVTRDQKTLDWTEFHGWFNFGDNIAVDDKAACDSAFIEILLANSNEKTAVFQKNMKLPGGRVRSNNEVVALNAELKKLFTEQIALPSTITKGGNGCNLVGPQYLFTTGKTGTTIYLPLNKSNCPDSKATKAQIQLMDCQSEKTSGNPNDLAFKKAENEWLVLSGKIAAGTCYQLSIANGSIEPIKIEAIAPVSSTPLPREKMELQTYQWRQGK